VSRALIWALTFAGIATTAQADGLSWHGVTVYGVIDVAAAYQEHGLPLSGSYPAGLDNIIGAKGNNHTVATFSPGGLSTSSIGLKIEENIGGGWVAIGKLETGFLPTSGELADACASLARASGKDIFHQIANGDSSRCGQALNGPAYAGISNSGYGTLTIGRQASLEMDAIAQYDPQGSAPGFSLIGFSGVTAGGGATQVGRWDNSLKYVYQYGPVHAAAMYTNGGQDTSLQGGGYSLNLGGTFKGISIDAVYAKERGLVSASSLTLATSGAVGTCNATGVGNGNVCLSNQVNATISDTETWSIQGKYTFELGGGGYKDDGPGAKLTVYGGYENITFSNPQDKVENGSTTIGGYVIVKATNDSFGTDRKLQVYWTGAKYELPSGWSFTGAYYRYYQDPFLSGATRQTCATTSAAVTTGIKVGSNCSGDLNSMSFVADYQFNKYFDVYAGVNYSNASGGLVSGFLNDNVTNVMTGVRLKF
jgi:predicted porin